MLKLVLLAGHRRYALITALRGGAVAAQALGMARVVSEDALRRVECWCLVPRSRGADQQSQAVAHRIVAAEPAAIDCTATDD